MPGSRSLQLLACRASILLALAMPFASVAQGTGRDAPAATAPTSSRTVAPSSPSAPPPVPQPAGAGTAGESRRAATRNLVLPAGADPAGTEGSITFIGTATVLIRYAGFTILTDPNFLHKGGTVGLGYGLTSRRLTEPAISLEQLPRIDLVVLSHFHGDHFDQLVQQRLDRAVPIVTTPQAAAQLRELGFTAPIPLGTWDKLAVSKGAARFDIVATPGRHGPPLVAHLLPQVMGSILTFSGTEKHADFRLYISGDTLIHDDLRDIPMRYPDIDLALLHLGGTRILGVLKVTMDGVDGMRMLELIAPRHAIPIHFDDYDVFKSPLSEFQQLVEASPWKDKVSYLKRGEQYRFHPRTR